MIGAKGVAVTQSRVVALLRDERVILTWKAERWGMDEHSAYIVVGAGWDSAAPIVVRVCAEAGTGPVLVEAPLGLRWTGRSHGPPRAWEELARRADLALAEYGYARTVDWEPHVYPQPIAVAKVSKSTSGLL